MTIQFNYPWNGYSGIQTLADAEETRLVGLGVARYYTPYMDGGPSNPEANNLELDPTTGAMQIGGAAPTPAQRASVLAGIGADEYLARSPDTGLPSINDSVFSPLDLSGCQLWLDATQGPVTAAWETPTDGQAVTTWLDNSGNARHATVSSGSPVYLPTGGYGGGPGVTGKMVTPAFVSAGYGNAMTMFCVSKVGASLHSALKIKVSISTASCWHGNVGTTGVRDLTLAGITGLGTGLAGGETPARDGIDYFSVGVDKVRAVTDGFGKGIGCSISTDEFTGTGGSIAFTNGAVFVGGLTGTTNFDWPGAMSEVILYSRELTRAEVRQVLRYLSEKWRSVKMVVAPGNSLTSGNGSTGGATQILLSTGTNYPGQLQALLGSSAHVRTDAYPGRTTDQIISGTPAFSGTFADHSKAVHLVWELTNTLGATGSPLKAFESIKKACLMKSGNGAKVIVGTCLYRGDSGNDAKNAALTDQVNALVRARYTEFAHGIADFAADARLQDFTNATYFDADETHLKDAGYAVVASIAHAAVTPFL